ncbi:Uncharacterised protein [Mycobacteroides abscessus subsp. abscessus]|nr:Uncharacterised protein [Mycobacteroides abscessus subsp. abscessus]
MVIFMYGPISSLMPSWVVTRSHTLSTGQSISLTLRNTCSSV